jgi:hypothetical protein
LISSSDLNLTGTFEIWRHRAGQPKNNASGF